jgi:hypothetical protein
LEPQDVFIEFFGVPRHQAGTAYLTVRARTVAEAITKVQEACLQLPQLLGPKGEINPHYLLSIDGQSFVAEAATRTLPPGTRLLILSADSGG